MSAGYELTRRGFKTLLIDAFDPPHPHGSHHGDTRLIRHAYSGGPSYVKLALRADELWRGLEEETGEKLLERAGVLNIADPDYYSYEGRFQDAADHGVVIEDLDAEQIRDRWPTSGFPIIIARCMSRMPGIYTAKDAYPLIRSWLCKQAPRC
ncbi:FAD-dependent oxidoreductase [Cohnella cholangitidis]|uniref:FAD-dependent oxidoreductase n=1 Tax=Cohnella cholangitidis TaxID=2598458 RepID=UPI002D21C6EB|nr:FAD-dependent oxidoreductase [Cohnella cholangitidis]